MASIFTQPAVQALDHVVQLLLSKITHAGAGVAFIGASAKVLNNESTFVGAL